MVEKGRLKVNPLADIKAKGSPNRGKPQLTMDEWSRFIRWCVNEALRGDEGAAAAAVVAAFGVRASEACGIGVRDVDQGGTVLVIRGTKSEAADRSLAVPRPQTPDDPTPNLWRLLQDQIVRAKRAERVQLFGRDRWWIRREVIRCCEAAGVPVVCPQGQRGTWASTARRVATAPVEVALSMGHAGTAVQDRHYAQPEARAAGAQRAALSVMKGGKA
jgi:integrase